MPYEFREYPFELEPEASSSRSGGPPRKSIGVDVLDPLGSPTRPVRHWAPKHLRLWIRGLAIAALIGIGLFVLLQFLSSH